MPTYEYACTACGQHVEVFQRLSEKPLTTCGVCGGPLRKVFHPAGIVFKGSGFYATDSRKPSSSSDGGSTEGKEAAKKTEGGGSADTKSGSATSSGSSGGSGASGSSTSPSSGSGAAKSSTGEKAS